jgi:hypothetical protein
VIPDEVPLNWLLRGGCLRAIEQLRFPKSFFLAKVGKRHAASAKKSEQGTGFPETDFNGYPLPQTYLGLIGIFGVATLAGGAHRSITEWRQ